MKFKFKKEVWGKIGVVCFFLFLWYWLFYQGKIAAHPELIKEIYQSSIRSSASGWFINDWLNRTLFIWLGTMKRVFLFESLLTSIYLGFWSSEWIKKKGLVAGIVIAILLPWFYWEIGRHPLELALALYFSQWLIDKSDKKNKIYWPMSLLALGTGKTSLLLSWWSTLKKKNIKLVIIVTGLGLMMLTRQIRIELDSGSLSDFRVEEMSQTINLRLGTEFTASGENLLPLKIKRIVFNKLVWPGYQVLRRGVSMFDSESWFFPYNMQQDLVWKEGLTEKNIFMAFDWLILLILIVGWSKNKKKNSQLLVESGLVLLVMGMVWGKLVIGEVLLVSLALIFSFSLQAWQEIRKMKFWFYVLIALTGLSIFTRGNLLLNYPQTWMDNRAAAYRFIANEIKDEKRNVLVSSAFGPGEMYVDFFLNQKNKNGKISFDELPQDSVWPEGVYAGLEGEFEKTVNKRTVLAEMEIRDKITKNLGQKVIVVEMEKYEK